MGVIKSIFHYLSHVIKRTLFVLQHEGLQSVFVSTIRHYEKQKQSGFSAVFGKKTTKAPYSFILQADPGKPLPPLALSITPRKKLDIGWVIPDFGVGSGGHTTIFRIISFLEKFGHTNTIYLYSGLRESRYTTGQKMKEVITKHFFPLKAECFVGTEHMGKHDAAFATSWDTAYPVYASHALGKFYFVQDNEPEFYATSSEKLFAENTYKLGLFCVTAGPWLAETMRSKYKAQADYFELAYDHTKYVPKPQITRNDNQICFYARYVTPRRGFELGVLSLQLLLKKRPDCKVVMYGWDVPEHLVPFPFENRSILTHDELCTLYNESTIGLVFSLTNNSLVPYEMMGCKLPVVELDHPSTRAIFSDREIACVQPTPYAVAELLERLLDSKEERTRLSEEAYKKVKKLSWEESARQVERILQSYTPEES